jgi:hypothetical protein
MAALDDIDGVDLQIAQVRHRCRRGLRTGAEGLADIQALGVQPDAPSLNGVEMDEWAVQSRSLQGSRFSSV